VNLTADPEPPVPAEHPYRRAILAERTGWKAITGTVRQLTPSECLELGYYEKPDWSVRDVIAHLGTWLAEAQVQLERMDAGTYEGHDVDVNAMNAEFLEKMGGQPWEVAWVQAHAARTRMLVEWYSHLDRTDEAAWWIRKSGAEHYTEHRDRLEKWTAELIARRETEAKAPTPPG
jgi:hypothetical protein